LRQHNDVEAVVTDALDVIRHIEPSGDLASDFGGRGLPRQLDTELDDLGFDMVGLILTPLDLVWPAPFIPVQFQG
jgi:hypothetical protein